MKLTDEFCWGVIDTETGSIVARSREGYLAIDRCAALNRKHGSGRYRYDPRDGEWRKDMSSRFDIREKMWD